VKLTSVAFSRLGTIFFKESRKGVATVLGPRLMPYKAAGCPTSPYRFGIDCEADSLRRAGGVIHRRGFHFEPIRPYVTHEAHHCHCQTAQETAREDCTSHQNHSADRLLTARRPSKRVGPFLRWQQKDEADDRLYDSEINFRVSCF
jgi:hypothetical protein